MLPERLKQLESNVVELLKFGQKNTVEAIKQDKAKEWALRYGLLESIQIVIDISCHIVVHKNLGNARTYSECIEMLQKYDYISTELSEKLVAMTGLRNILVHEYINVDPGQLFKMLDNLEDFRHFANTIKQL